MPTDTVYFPFSEIADITNWPLGSLIPDGLEKLWLSGPQYDEESQTGHIGLVIDGEVALRVPGLDFATFALGSIAGSVDFELVASFEPFRLGVQVPVTLRLDANILRPIKGGTGFEPDLEAETLDIALGTISLSIDGEGNLDLGLSAAVQIPRCMVGTSGVIIEGKIRWLTPVTPGLPPRTPTEFTGFYLDDVVVEIPQLPAAVNGIRMDDVFIGTGGFSGIISKPGLELKWENNDFTGSMHGELFGFKGGISSMSIEFRQNALVGCEIKGDIFVPYFNKRVGLTLGLDGTGGLTATAALPHSLPPETGVTPGSPGYLIHLDVLDVLSLDIASLRFEARGGNLPRLGISGRVAPGSGVLEFPPIELTGLWIDTRGRIHTEGDGIRLPSRYVMNFHGFQLEISKLGFGNTEEGGKWIGFTGGVKLVAGMPAGASVEGLRITWYEDGRRPIQITLNGVRVDFEVPNTLKFSGAVSYISDKQQFQGAIKLDLIALKMQVDATAVFGIEQGQNYLGIYLAAQFPAGIPLFATGLGVYGMAGLFALNMEPKRLPTQPWYEIGSTSDWYHSPPAGVTSLKDKWTARLGSMAFGAGVTLGTLADNGHAFSAQMLLAIVFPGPILLLQGSANLLKERATLDTDATFRAIAVLDGRAGTLQVGLDAQYRFDNSGALIDIRGAAEGFFNFNDPNAWRLNVGLKDPRERRLTARLFQLFEANAYVMLNAQQLAMGAWIGFKQQWQFGPLSVALEAWIDGNARVSWKPAHFYGDLWLHGSARLAVFGFGVGLTVNARIAADVFNPFHVVGQFSVAIDLPWPFSDISVNINLEWGPDPSPPPLPVPLKEVAIEHFKATTSWPLPRDLMLFPDYDENRDGFAEFPPVGGIPAGKLDHAPIVPLDCRPHITFARNINDDALVGVNPQRVIPEWERIGDPVRNQGPARIRYGLKEVVLEKFTGERWEPVARKAKDANASGVATLYGSWAPVPQMPGGGGRNAGQVKLWLWSKNPFEYTRRTSRAWDEWFNDRFGGYPCSSIADICWDFKQIEPGRGLSNPWQHPAEEQLRITTNRIDGISIINLNQPVQGFTRALCATLPAHIKIDLPQPTDIVRIRALEHGPGPESFSGRDADGRSFPVVIVTEPDGFYFEIRGRDIVGIDIVFKSPSVPGKSLASQLGGAIGCDYVRSRNQLVFVELEGKLSSVDLSTGRYTVLGTGYTNPEDVVVTADGTKAFITEQAGTLLRVDLTSGRADRSQAVVLVQNIVNPHQIFIDEARNDVYVLSGGTGRVLRADMDRPVHAVVVTDKLDQAVGLLVDSERNFVYVSEQGSGGRILRIEMTTGARETVIGNLPSLYFMRWADAERRKILVPQRDPHNRVYLIDVVTRKAEVFIHAVAHRPSSIALLPEELVAICSDKVIHACRTAYCLLSICNVRAPLLIRHFEEELARWSQQAEVLEPHTRYRLKIVTSINARGEGKLRWYSADKDVTEFTYFRTAGPPGVAKLTTPIGSEALETFTTPLDDLTRYVQRTMPRAVEPTPDTPVPPRLFYRAYDVGLEFNENYVDLMYRFGRRDLTIHLYDGNGAIRDENGRRLVLANQWSEAEEVTLTEREERWISVLRSSGCTLVDAGSIVKNTTFNAPSEPHVLPPQALCEARLVPALLHDAFASYGDSAGATGPNGRFEQWQVQDDPGSAASRWEIAEGPERDFVLVQTTDAATTLVYANVPESPQENPDQPSTWTDYRLQVHLQSTDGRIGVVWRYQNVGRHYRFVMDRQAGTRELIRIEAGNPTVLASDSFTYTPEQTYVVTVEALKSSFRVYQDGEFVFAVTDPVLSEGTVGVHCAGNPTARFTDIFVDDFRTSAPIVYQFSFLTSRFKNFVDHLGSFENETWRVELSSGVNVAPSIGAAVLPSAAASEAESRAYDALFTQLPVAALSPVVRVTRVEQNGSAIAFLVQTPEPLDWRRIDLEVLRAELQTTQYIPVEERVLRKFDGSGLMIVVPSNGAGSLLSPGEYRLNFTYRRDNRAIDSQSELLSEAGHTTPEQATLDIPWQTLV